MQGEKKAVENVTKQIIASRKAYLEPMVALKSEN